MLDLLGKTIVLSLVLSLLWHNAGCVTTDTENVDNPVAEAILKFLPANATDKRIMVVEKISSEDADIRREGVKM
ncbi:MAG: hypothetical protein GY869_06315, partial [Planctomycetes bacterium]|nr:hypothetical protein [Planctomycetota bacterium]